MLEAALCMSCVSFLSDKSDIWKSHKIYCRAFFKFQWNLKFNGIFSLTPKKVSALHEEAKSRKDKSGWIWGIRKWKIIILHYNSSPVWPIPYTFKFIKNAIILIEGAQLAAKVIMNLEERETQRIKGKKDSEGNHAKVWVKLCSQISEDKCLKLLATVILT